MVIHLWLHYQRFFTWGSTRGGNRPGVSSFAKLSRNFLDDCLPKHDYSWDEQKCPAKLNQFNSGRD
jgi:hypothetical protein